MKRNKFEFEIGLGIVFVVLYAIFSYWYGGCGRGKLAQEEVEAYLSKLEKEADLPKEAKRGCGGTTAHLGHDG